MNRNGKRFLTVLCLIMAVGLAGCGKTGGTQIAYPDEDAEDAATASDAATERISYELESSGGISITADAEVVGTEKLSDMYCYDAEPITFDETYLDEHTADVFDEGTAEYIKPYDVCDETELKIRMNELKDIQAEADASDEILQNGVSVDMAIVQFLLDYGTDEKVISTGKPEGKIYATVDDAEIETSYARVDGSVDGVPYVYQAVNLAELDMLSLSYERYDYLGMEVSVREKLADEEAQGLDADTAQGQADAFLKTIGYGDFSACQTNLATYRYSYGGEQTQIDAYVFSYSRNVNGIAVATSPGSASMEFSAEQGGTLNQEDIEVVVDANGVAKVNIRLAVYDVAADGTKVESYLSLEQVDAAAQEYLSTYTDTQGFSEITIDSVRLTYIYIQYEDGRIGLIPAWSYYGEKGDTRRIFLFGVSAIDGQMIQGEYATVEDVHFLLN